MLSTKKLEQLEFYKRCEEDPLFFIENCVTVPQIGGYELVKLYEPQRQIVIDFMENHNIIMNKSRQTGGSYIVQSLCAWLVLFYDNYVIGVVSKTGKESSKFNQKVLSILDNIPQDFIRPKNVDYDYRNVQSFKLKTTDSELITQAVSRENPEITLRGNSLGLLIIDEAAFIKNIDKAYTGIMPSTSKSQDMALKKNIPFGNFIISTPNGTRGVGEWYFKQWMKSVRKESFYINRCIHWRDTGQTEEWYKIQCAALDNDPKKIAQEMEMQFISSEGSVWSDTIQMKLNDIITKNEEMPNRYKEINMITYNGKLTIFKQNPNFNKFYLIGVDTASASGSDYSVIEIFDYETCEQVAEFVGKLEPKLFGEVVKKICRMFRNNVIIVENTGGFGITVLNELQFDTEMSYELYGEYKNNDSKNTLVPGLSSNIKSRPLMIEALYNFVNESYECIHSSHLCSELLSLVQSKSGKILAESNYNDDTVMATAFIFYVRQYRPDYLLHKTMELESNLSDNSESKYSNQIAFRFMNDIKSISSSINVSEINRKDMYRYGFDEDEIDDYINPINQFGSTKDKLKNENEIIDTIDTTLFKQISN